MGGCWSRKTEPPPPEPMKLMRRFPLLELDDAMLIRILSFVNEKPSNSSRCLDDDGFSERLESQSFPLRRVFPYVCRRFQTLVYEDESLWRNGFERVLRDPHNAGSVYWEFCIQQFIKENQEQKEEDENEGDDGKNRESPHPRLRDDPCGAVGTIVHYHPKDAEGERIQTLFTKAHMRYVVAMTTKGRTKQQEIEGKDPIPLPTAGTKIPIRDFFKHMVEEYYPWNPPRGFGC